MSKDDGFKLENDKSNKFVNYSLSDFATKNVKCPSCGMFNPPTLEKCRKCKADIPKQEEAK